MTRNQRLQNIITLDSQVTALDNQVNKLLHQRSDALDALGKENSALISESDMPNKFMFEGYLFTIDTDVSTPAYWIRMERVQELQPEVELIPQPA